MADIDKQLGQIFHLEPYQARLYRAALKVPYASVTDLAKLARIARTAVYHPLQAMLTNGYIQPIRIGKRIRYRATPPDELVLLLDQKKIALTSLLPELTQTLAISGQGIEVTYYPGVDGLLLASDVFLEETVANMWKIFENPLHTLEVAGIPQTEAYVRRRVHKGISARVVAPAEITNVAWLREKSAKNAEELREVILVSRRSYPLDASIATNGQSVLALVAQGTIFAVLIRNPVLARTVESIHDMVWDRFKPE